MKSVRSPDQLPRLSFFQICFLRFVRLRLQHQFSSVDMKKSVAFALTQSAVNTHTFIDTPHVFTNNTSVAAVRLGEFDTIS